MESENDIIISGITAHLPASENAEEFMENLLNGVDMVTESSRRFPPGN